MTDGLFDWVPGPGDTHSGGERARKQANEHAGQSVQFGLFPELGILLGILQHLWLSFQGCPGMENLDKNDSDSSGSLS